VRREATRDVCATKRKIHEVKTSPWTWSRRLSSGVPKYALRK
jgi:hypothetical protein